MLQIAIATQSGKKATSLAMRTGADIVKSANKENSAMNAHEWFFTCKQLTTLVHDKRKSRQAFRGIIRHNKRAFVKIADGFAYLLERKRGDVILAVMTPLLNTCLSTASAPSSPAAADEPAITASDCAAAFPRLISQSDDNATLLSEALIKNLTADQRDDVEDFIHRTPARKPHGNKTTESRHKVRDRTWLSIVYRAARKASRDFRKTGSASSVHLDLKSVKPPSKPTAASVDPTLGLKPANETLYDELDMDIVQLLVDVFTKHHEYIFAVLMKLDETAYHGNLLPILVDLLAPSCKGIVKRVVPLMKRILKISDRMYLRFWIRVFRPLRLLLGLPFDTALSVIHKDNKRVAKRFEFTRTSAAPVVEQKLSSSSSTESKTTNSDDNTSNSNANTTTALIKKPKEVVGIVSNLRNDITSLLKLPGLAKAHQLDQRQEVPRPIVICHHLDGRRHWDGLDITIGNSHIINKPELAQVVGYAVTSVAFTGKDTYQNIAIHAKSWFDSIADLQRNGLVNPITKQQQSTENFVNVDGKTRNDITGSSTHKSTYCHGTSHATAVQSQDPWTFWGKTKTLEWANLVSEAASGLSEKHLSKFALKNAGQRRRPLWQLNYNNILVPILHTILRVFCVLFSCDADYALRSGFLLLWAIHITVCVGVHANVSFIGKSGRPQISIKGGNILKLLDKLDILFCCDSCPHKGKLFPRPLADLLIEHYRQFRLLCLEMTNFDVPLARELLPSLPLRMLRFFLQALALKGPRAASPTLCRWLNEYACDQQRCLSFDFTIAFCNEALIEIAHQPQLAFVLLHTARGGGRGPLSEILYQLLTSMLVNERTMHEAHCGDDESITLRLAESNRTVQAAAAAKLRELLVAEGWLGESPTPAPAPSSSSSAAPADGRAQSTSTSNAPADSKRSSALGSSPPSAQSSLSLMPSLGPISSPRPLQLLQSPSARTVVLSQPSQSQPDEQSNSIPAVQEEDNGEDEPAELDGDEAKAEQESAETELKQMLREELGEPASETEASEDESSSNTVISMPPPAPKVKKTEPFNLEVKSIAVGSFNCANAVTVRVQPFRRRFDLTFKLLGNEFVLTITFDSVRNIKLPEVNVRIASVLTRPTLQRKSLSICLDLLREPKMEIVTSEKPRKLKAAGRDPSSGPLTAEPRYLWNLKDFSNIDVLKKVISADVILRDAVKASQPSQALPFDTALCSSNWNKSHPQQQSPMFDNFPKAQKDFNDASAKKENDCWVTCGLCSEQMHPADTLTHFKTCKTATNRVPITPVRLNIKPRKPRKTGVNLNSAKGPRSAKKQRLSRSRSRQVKELKELGKVEDMTGKTRSRSPSPAKIANVSQQDFFDEWDTEMATASDAKAVKSSKASSSTSQSSAASTTRTKVAGKHPRSAEEADEDWDPERDADDADDDADDLDEDEDMEPIEQAQADELPQIDRYAYDGS